MDEWMTDGRVLRRRERVVSYAVRVSDHVGVVGTLFRTQAQQTPTRDRTDTDVGEAVR